MEGQCTALLLASLQVLLNMEVQTMEMALQVRSAIRRMRQNTKNNESYNEKVCYTNHNEKCNDVGSQRCKAIKTSKHVRKCHDVSELLCFLKESVQHEEIPAVFTVQKCHTVTERVCDTAYDTQMTERDDFK